MQFHLTGNATKTSDEQKQQNQTFLRLFDGWVSPLNGYKYKVNGQTLTWSASQNVCQNEGGNLVAERFQSMEVQK